MKILILSFYYAPDLCAGSFRATALVEQLRQEVGPEVHIDVLTTAPNRYFSFSVDAPAIEQRDGLTIHRIALPQHNSGMLDQSKAFIHFAKKVRELVKSEQYTLVFATSSRLMTAALGAWVARKKRAKLYLDIRDIFVDTLNDILPRKLSCWSKPIFSVLEKWSFKRASHINLVSKGFQSYFETRYPTQTFSWFTNGIDSEFIDITVQAKPFSPKRLTIVYAGNIGEGQGLHAIIPSLAKRMEETLYFKIIGDGGRLDRLKAEINRLGCCNVTIQPPLNRSQLLLEYEKADVLFLHLNDYDAFKKVLPSKLFEYAAIGKPIWAGVSGYSAEFVLSEITNAVVFQPCDSADAERVFKSLILETQPRQNFVMKYSRQHIMKNMALDILSLAEM